MAGNYNGGEQMTSEAQKRAAEKYDRENTVQFKIKLNRKTDADMIRHLQEQDNRQGYIKQLIREDMGK